MTESFHDCSPVLEIIEGVPLPRRRSVSYWNEYFAEKMRSDFAELAMRRFEVGNFEVHVIPSIVDERTL